MTARRVGTSGLLLLCGCVSLPSESPASVRDRDTATFGVGIIRPGMTKAEVDAVFKSSGVSLPYVTGGQFVNWIEVNYSDLVVSFSPFFLLDNPAAKVIDCRFSRTIEEGDVVATFTDEQLKHLLRVGMSAVEVAGQIGSPVGAYENKPGKVFTVHPQPGIVIEYTGGRLKDWKRHHDYKPLPAASPAADGKANAPAQKD